MQERIVARLTAGLEPQRLDIIDESDRHAGHAGARQGGGTHYRVRIVSGRFAGLSRVARHRLVYGLLPAEFADGLHALAVDAKGAGGDMTVGSPDSFGPYAFTLAAAEAEAAAARLGLRDALRGGLLANHLAPLGGLCACPSVRLDSHPNRLCQPAGRRGDASPRRRGVHDPAADQPLAHPARPQERKGGDREAPVRWRAGRRRSTTTA